jgi:hypothetical protein
MHQPCPDLHLIQIYRVRRKDIGETIISHILAGF